MLTCRQVWDPLDCSDLLGFSAREAGALWPKEYGICEGPIAGTWQQPGKQRKDSPEQEEGGDMGMVWHGLGPSPPPQLDSLLRQTDGETGTWPVLLEVKREGSRFSQALVSKSWYCYLLVPLGKLLTMCEP